MEGLPHRTCFGNDVTAPFVREERRGENAGRLLVNGHDSDFDDDTLAYYGVRLLVLHDISAIRGKDQPGKLKDEERYAKEAGKLMLFLAAGSLIMTVLLYFQVIAAVVQIVVWIIVFGILWKKMDERYGA